MSLAQWKDRLRWMFRREIAENDLDQELRAHLAIEERQRTEAGESPEAARAGARRDLGNELLIKEATRGVWGRRWLEDLARDLGYGARVLRKNPGFAAVAILTLAIGIGCNTAMFSIINAVLLRPLPFREPDRLINMQESQPSMGYPVNMLNPQDYLDWKEQNHALEDAALYDGVQNYNASGAGNPETVRVTHTEANFFSVLGVQPLQGRAFAQGEDAAGKNRLVMLSYSFWQQHYGGREDALGAQLLLDEQPYTVIGVMPAWFNFPARAKLWTPLDMHEERQEPRGNHSFRGLGRMKPGITLQQTRADLDRISEQLGAQYPETNRGETSLLQPLQERLTGGSRPQLLVLMAAVALVLLVACANVANLLLSRATGRRQEMALRAALGAKRLRLVRQLLTESVLLSVLGASLGLLLAAACISIVQKSASLRIPRQTPVQIDWTVLAFAGSVSIVVGLLFGMAPALQASVQHLANELKTAVQSLSGSGGWRNRLRDALVSVEIALSLALLMGAGLLLRTFVKMRSTDVGVARENVTTLELVLPTTGYATTSARNNFYQSLLDMIRAEPGVQHAGISLELPLEGSRGKSVKLKGDSAETKHAIEWNVVTEEYFSAMGIPLLSGRTFDVRDMQMTAETIERMETSLQHNPNTTVKITYPVVVNQTLARALFPGQDAVGKNIFMGFETGEIVGVVGDVKQEDIRRPAFPEAFGPLTAEIMNHWFPAAVSVRSTTAPGGVVNAARRSLAQLDPSLAFFNVRIMEEVIAENMEDTSLQTALLGAFAGMALLLAAIGLYGVMAYAVAQRTREIGIRMALGARPRSVMAMVMGRGGRLTLAGVALGAPAAFGLARLMSKLLFGVSAADPLTFVAVACLLSAVAMVACYIPARRAMAVDRIVALRYE